MPNKKHLTDIEKLLSTIFEHEEQNSDFLNSNPYYNDEYEDDEEYDFDEPEYETKLLKNIDPELIAFNKDEIQDTLRILQKSIIELKNKFIDSDKLNQMAHLLQDNSFNDKMNSKLSFTEAINQTDLSVLMNDIAIASNVEEALKIMAEVFINLDNKVLSRDEINNIYSALINTIASFKEASEKKLSNDIDSYDDLMNFNFVRTSSSDFAFDPIDDKTYLVDKINLIKAALIASIYMRVNTEINTNEDTKHWTMNQNQVALNILMFELIEKTRERNKKYQLKKTPRLRNR